MFDIDKIKTESLRSWFVRRVLRSILALLVVLLSSVVAAQAAIPASERATLENIYAYTSGSGWANQTGWNGPSGTECSWDGVTCNRAGTTVIGLDLSYKGLFGVLPSLDGLSHLQSFVIKQPRDPMLDGPRADVYGDIPALQGLKDLKTFIVDQGFTRGGIPSLAGMTSLEHFECRYCALSGSIASLRGLTHLKYFYVSGDPLAGRLSGSIPSLAGLTQLQYFNVSGDFTGKLPDLSGLTQLQTFQVDGYQFSDGVPDLVDLPYLQTFVVTGLITGHLGILSNLPNLQTYSTSGDLITGHIPQLGSLPHLQYFGVAANQLTGSIPDLSGLPQLQRLEVSRNRLTGSIPDLSALLELQLIDVQSNQLSGALPVPPASMIDYVEDPTHGHGLLCPNRLVPASNPPSALDLKWNTIVQSTPWSKDCESGALAKSELVVRASRVTLFAGQSVTLTAVVRGLHPTGTVTFEVQSDQPGTTASTILCDRVPLLDQVASCTTSDLPNNGSTMNIYATYSGDANNTPDDNSLFPGEKLFGAPILYVKDNITESSTASTVQVGQPVDLALTYSDGRDGDTVSFYDGPYGAKPLCENVPVHTSRAGQFIAHCGTQFTTIGPHVVSARTSRSYVDPIVLTVVAAKPFDADQFALTGPWYNSATSGQGLQFAVYPDHAGSGVATLTGGWFTYDAAGHLRWMAIQGELSASHGGTFDLQVGQGSGGNFNAAPVTLPTMSGSATLTFYDCGHAALDYHLDDGRSGTMAYTRINTPPYGCLNAPGQGVADPPPANYNDAQRSGAWYNPATSGQGVFVDLSSWQNSFFATWYTYAPQDTSDTGVARERWFTLQGNDYTAGDLNLKNVAIIATSGGVFGQPSAVETQQVGTAHITFNSCTSMTLAYSFDKGEFSGLSGSINEQVVAVNPACH